MFQADRKKGEKLESFFAGGIHQTTLLDVTPSIWDKEKWRDNLQIYNILTYDELQELKMTAYGIIDMTNQELRRRLERRMSPAEWDNLMKRRKKGIEHLAKEQQDTIISHLNKIKKKW
ncbi:MAG: hypothetical protein M3258_07030 [Thermoproteota archaeon]|nr:hypothetical protein [Thermoproteota archaeon]